MPAKNKGGRPSGFTEKTKAKIEKLAKRGFTHLEIAEIIDVTERTITNWVKKYPELFLPLKDWKAEADEKVEVSLYERACGYEHLETKVQYVNDEWQTKDITKHYPPDPTSMIFWLKNRQPSKWRDKAEIDVTHIIDKITVEFVKAGD